MDVVLNHIKRLRGSIGIQSTKGHGTTFTIRLPLTLGIIDGVVVNVGVERYIIPTHSLIEMVRPSADTIVPHVNNCEVVCIRGCILPVIRLYRYFKIESQINNLLNGILIVCQSDNCKFCLFVDDIICKQKVVIKNLGHKSLYSNGIMGCAILGDGHIGMILDMHDIFVQNSSNFLDMEQA